MNHLAIYNKKAFDKDFIVLMLNGSRTIGLKFLSRKTAPYNNLHTKDTIYLKESSGPIRGRVIVASVSHIELTDPEQIMQFLSEHAGDIGIENETQLMDIWKRNANSRYLCWWTMTKPQSLTRGITIHKNDRRAWVADYDVPEEVLAAL